MTMHEIRIASDLLLIALGGGLTLIISQTKKPRIGHFIPSTFLCVFGVIALLWELLP